MSYNALESSTYGAAPFELYRFTMGTEAWYLTSGEEARTYLGHTYAPDMIERSEVEHNQETSSGTIEVTIPLESSLAKEFISFVPPNPMWLTVFAGHDGDDDVVVHFKGRVQQVKFGESCVMTVESGTSAIRKKIPPMVYQQSCNRIHYSPLCGATVNSNAVVNPGAPATMKNSWTAKVGSISGFQITIDPGASPEFVEAWTIGPNPSTPSNQFPADEDVYPRLSWGIASSADGLRMMIARHVGWNVIELKAPLHGLQPGDTITVTRGCRRNVKCCAFYLRISQYMGFDLQSSTNPFSGVM